MRRSNLCRVEQRHADVHRERIVFVLHRRCFDGIGPCHEDDQQMMQDGEASQMEFLRIHVHWLYTTVECEKVVVRGKFCRCEPNKQTDRHEGNCYICKEKERKRTTKTSLMAHQPQRKKIIYRYH